MAVLRLCCFSFVCALLTACLPTLPGKGPLDDAVRNGDLAMVDSWMNYGLNPNALNSRVVSPLMRATQMGRADIMRSLLKGGADVNAQSATLETSVAGGKVSTPLCQALGTGNVEVVKVLHEHNASWHFANGEAVAACWIYSRNHNLEVLGYMVQQGISFAPKAWNQGSALGQYVYYANGSPAEMHKRIRLMQKAGANINYMHNRPVNEATDPRKLAPLHTAAIDLKPSLIKAFLDAGAKVNQKSLLGETALHYATRYACNTCIVQLIEAGADLYARNSKGLPPVGVALHNPVVLELIASAGGLSALTMAERHKIIANQGYVSPSVKSLLLDTKLNTKPYQQALVSLDKDLLPKRISQRTAKQRMQSEKQRVAKQLQKERAAQQRARQAQAEKKRQQALLQQQREIAKKAVQKVLRTTPELDELLTTVGDAKKQCKSHNALVSEVSRFQCRYENRYKEYFTSEPCTSLREQLSDIVDEYRDQVCDNYKKAQKAAAKLFDDRLQQEEIHNQISLRAFGKGVSAKVLANRYNIPLRDLERLREESRKAHINEDAERERRAWNAVARAASSAPQAHVSAEFKKTYNNINQVLINQANIQRLEASVDKQLAKINAQQKIQQQTTQPASKSLSKTQLLAKSKAACDAKGGRFDADINNCTIFTQSQTTIVQQLPLNTVGGSSTAHASNSVSTTLASNRATANNNSATSNKGSSSSARKRNRQSGNSNNRQTNSQADNLWQVRLDCGNTNFDKTMPEPAVVCKNTAPPLWTITWHYKHFMDGIRLVRLHIDNESDVGLDFVMNGRVSSDMDQRDFDWRVSVPANSRKTKSDGMDLPDAPHVMTINHLKFRP